MKPDDIFSVARRASRIGAVTTILGIGLMGSAVTIAWIQVRQLRVESKALATEIAQGKEELSKQESLKNTLEAAGKRLRDELESERSRFDLIKNTQRRLEEAIRLQTDRRYYDSIQLLKSILAEDDKNEVAWFRLARAHIALGSDRDALLAIESALKQDSTYFEASVVRSLLLLKQDSVESALELLKVQITSSITGYQRLREMREFEDIRKFRSAQGLFFEHENRLKAIQIRLRAAGVYSTKIDGIIGGKTKSAIAELVGTKVHVDDLAVADIEKAINMTAAKRLIE